MIGFLCGLRGKTLADVLTTSPASGGAAALPPGTRPSDSSRPLLASWLIPASPEQVPAQRGLVNRRRLLDDVLSESDKRQRRAIARKSDRNIGIAVLSFGCATLGHLFWPLRLLSLSASLYLTAHLYKAAYQLLRRGKVGIPTLMVVSITGALAVGYIWIASFVLITAQLARKLTATVMMDSRSSLVDVFRQAPSHAWVRVDGVEVQTPVELIQAGQTVVVGAGEVIPADGTVAAGEGAVDQQLLTGEARPVEKSSGDTVFAGTVVLSGRLEIAVEKAGGETAVARIGQILNATTEYKSEAQLRAETLAQRTVAPTLIAGALAIPFLGPMGGLAVVDAHFRQRMSILAPIALMNYLNIAARHGILIKDGRSLDLLGRVDTLVFDKTGTLTEEQPTVVAVYGSSHFESGEVLRYAAAAEQKQAHPIARAILAESRTRGLDIPALDEADYQVGLGLTVLVENRLVQVGSRRFIESQGIVFPEELEQAFEPSYRQGHSLVMVAIDGALAGVVELAPTVRPEASQVIEDLRHRHGIRDTYIISGDQEAPTRELAARLGIDHYFAETLPENKAALIDRLIAEGRFVCYVGDGINDAIALKKAHVSISLRGASSVAVDTAQIVLMEGDLRHLPDLFEYARGFHANTNRAFAISVVPTVIGIGGALFLHFTMVHTAFLALGSIFLGLGNAMLPLLRHREKPVAAIALMGEKKS
ncbi:MAG: heavy metal translocating P-type ATPase [Methylococcus sp.]